MIDQYQILLRVLVAAVLGAVIGFERERQNQPAGLRTHTILAIGATLAMTLSINIALQFKPLASGDPARLAAQVVSGIGFLGAGAILRYGNNIRGLTTATSLWTLAIVGMTVGAGHFVAGIATTVLLLLVLSLLDEVERRFIKAYKIIQVSLEMDDHPGVLEDIRQVFKDPGTILMKTNVARDMTKDLASFDLTIRMLKSIPLDRMVTNLVALKGIQSFKIKENELE